MTAEICSSGMTSPTVGEEAGRPVLNGRAGWRAAYLFRRGGRWRVHIVSSCGRRAAFLCRIAVVAASATVLLASCGPAVTSGGGGSSAGRVISLRTVAAVKAAFNHDAGHPRLVLLFSPT